MRAAGYKHSAAPAHYRTHLNCSGSGLIVAVIWAWVQGARWGEVPLPHMAESSRVPMVAVSHGMEQVWAAQ